jgi:hypothetical protein
LGVVGTASGSFRNWGERMGRATASAVVRLGSFWTIRRSRRHKERMSGASACALGGLRTGVVTFLSGSGFVTRWRVLPCKQDDSSPSRMTPNPPSSWGFRLPPASAPRLALWEAHHGWQESDFVLRRGRHPRGGRARNRPGDDQVSVAGPSLISTSFAVAANITAINDAGRTPCAYFQRNSNGSWRGCTENRTASLNSVVAGGCSAYFFVHGTGVKLAGGGLGCRLLRRPAHGSTLSGAACFALRLRAMATLPFSESQ